VSWPDGAVAYDLCDKSTTCLKCWNLPPRVESRKGGSTRSVAMEGHQLERVGMFAFFEQDCGNEGTAAGGGM
jgi:hypothetical protein